MVAGIMNGKPLVFKLAIVSIAATFLSGCWSLNPIIHPNRLLDDGTRVEIVAASKEVLINPAAASEQIKIDTMMQRIIELTREELSSRDIDAYTVPTPGAARLIYEIRAVNLVRRTRSSLFGDYPDNKFEVAYRVTFENPEGKRIFTSNDTTDDNDIEEICEYIASRSARNVENSFK